MIGEFNVSNDILYGAGKSTWFAFASPSRRPRRQH